MPLTAVLLIDSSHQHARRAAARGARRRALVRLRHGRRSTRRCCCCSRTGSSHHTPWSADPDELLAGLDGVEARGGSAVNDHLFLALQLLEKRQGRRVVILLSDGVDVESLLQAAQVNEIAVRSQALVYWIRVSAEPFDLLQRSAWRDVVEHSAEIRQLAATVDASGGRRIDIQRFEDAAGAFQQILTELRQQYVLGFYPDRARGTTVPGTRSGSRSTPRSVLLRTREGYYDD